MNYLYNVKHYAGLIICLFSAVWIFAQEPAFPVPQGNPKQLFYLQHSPNANTLVYEINFKNGLLDPDEPVHVFWIKYAEKGQKTELSSLQRNFGYGIRSTKISEDNYELRIISYKNVVLYLRRDVNKKYTVYTMINQKPAVLVRIYLKINGGSFWSPNIEYAEITGVDSDQGTDVSERIIIKF